MSEMIDVREIMQQAGARIRERWALNGPNIPDASADPDTAELMAALSALRMQLALIGEMPARDWTLRARAGALLVRMVRRALFWYTPPLRAFLGAVVEVLECQTLAIARAAAANRELRRSLAEIREELAELSSQPGPSGVAPGGGPENGGQESAAP